MMDYSQKSCQISLQLNKHFIILYYSSNKIKLLSLINTNRAGYVFFHVIVHMGLLCVHAQFWILPQFPFNMQGPQDMLTVN